MKNLKIYAEKIDAVLLCLLALLLPFGFLLPVVIVVLCINRVLFFDYSFRINRAPFFILLSYYLIHLLGMAWTENTSSGWFDLEVKFSFLILPFIFQPFIRSTKIISLVISWFLTGCIASSILCLLSAAWTYFLTAENHFFYIPFSIFIHPGYSSMYNNLALSFVLLSFFQDNFNISTFKRILLIVSLLIFNILYSSKTGIIVMILLFLLFIVLLALRRKKTRILVSGITGLVVLTAGFYYFIPEVRERLKTITSSVTNPNPDKTTSESSAVRILIWKASLEIIQANPAFGAGTGDGKDVLLNQYKKEGMTGAYEHRLGTHNQFLQSLLTTGVLGLISLLMILVFSLYHSFKNKNILFLFFILNAAVNFMTESVLETQAGVIFFVFFTCLFLFNNGTKEENFQFTLKPGK